MMISIFVKFVEALLNENRRYHAPGYWMHVSDLEPKFWVGWNSSIFSWCGSFTTRSWGEVYEGEKDRNHIKHSEIQWQKG